MVPSSNTGSGGTAQSQKVQSKFLERQTKLYRGRTQQCSGPRGPAQGSKLYADKSYPRRCKQWSECSGGTPLQPPSKGGGGGAGMY